MKATEQTRPTKKQRVDIVKLLLCAADINSIAAAAAALRLDSTIYDFAIDARDAVKVHRNDYRARLLEAAVRVEEGSWPVDVQQSPRSRRPTQQSLQTALTL